MNTPTVSVVIPCYNVGDLVKRAVESCIAQAPHITEIVCVDDGSTDNTRSTLESLKNSYGTVLRIVLETHQGAATARNTGLKNISGEYVQFLDADDELLPGKISNQLDLIRFNHGADIVVGSYIRVSPWEPDSVHVPILLDKWSNLIFTSLGITSSNLWKRERVLTAGGWNETLDSSQEYDLLFKMMMENTSLVYDYLPLTKKHERTGSIQSIRRNDPEKFKKNLQRSLDLRKRIAEYLESQGIFDDDRRKIYMLKMQNIQREFIRIDKLLSINHEEKKSGED